jgi:hypothetical protein
MYVIYSGHEGEELEIHMVQIVFPFKCFGVFVMGHIGKPATYDELVSGS